MALGLSRTSLLLKFSFAPEQNEPPISFGGKQPISGAAEGNFSWALFLPSRRLLGRNVDVRMELRSMRYK
jgi:hypothetical protein